MHNFLIVGFGKSFLLFQGKKRFGPGAAAKTRIKTVEDVM
jgi:hypothetical protein